MATTRFFADDLIEFSASTYRALGVSNKDASLLVETLCQADLRGHQSLGVMHTFWYAEHMRTSATRIQAQPELVIDAGAIAVIELWSSMPLRQSLAYRRWAPEDRGTREVH